MSDWNGFNQMRTTAESTRVSANLFISTDKIQIKKEFKMQARHVSKMTKENFLLFLGILQTSAGIEFKENDVSV